MSQALNQGEESVDNQDVIVLDTEKDDIPTGTPSLQKNRINELIEENDDFDRLRIKTPLFTKEYDNNFNLLSVEPFFVDVRFGVIDEPVEIEETYTIDRTGAKVTIYDRQNEAGYIYHLSIPEMAASFGGLKELKRKLEDFQDTGNTDNPIIQRWYQEYGILEHLLFDDKIQEINVNPPAHETSVRIVHESYDECVSNIYPTEEFLNYLSTRLKISSGRPLNRAKPRLDGEIEIEGQRARVAAVTEPFSMFGTGYSIRRHRDNPWTLPLFINNETINPVYAGLMSFAITQGRTFLTAGPRGSGKTSMLGALILEILPKYRIITVEDTAELPVEAYKDYGYDIVPFKVRSALLEEGFEMPFDKGLRTTLRLGDSALILGEIRSTEAKVLYEAMRVGAMSNTVAGTIHADDPYGVYDRVVNDLGVPKGSFKVTDLIIIQNQIKTATGLSRKRRVLKVAEVDNDWEEKPTFTELLVYNAEEDRLEPTEALLNGESHMLQEIQARSGEHKSHDDVLADIRLRGWAKKSLVELVDGNNELLEAEIVQKANTALTLLHEKHNPLRDQESRDAFKKAYLNRIKEIVSEQS